MPGPGEHSPVGASAIKRVLACPASVALATGIEDEESDHAALGTVVHSVIEECFRRNIDAWELVGNSTCEGYPIDKAMSVAAQVMLTAVRTSHPDRNQGNFWVERRFHCPTIHPLFFGTSDAVFWDEAAKALHIWDYKNGAGVIIEVEGNEQGMYYACGALEDLDLWDIATSVVIHIVQPNGFHGDGPVRQWATTPDDLVTWLEDTLVPGIVRSMQAVELGDYELNTASGEHCRFCPARTHACPQLMADMAELETLMETMNKAGGADALTPEQLSRLLTLTETAKIVGKAAQTTAFKRISAGARIEGWKLAKAKANREWKEGADAAAMTEFGAKGWTEPKPLSPAQIDLLPTGTAFTARWAFKPDTGLTLVKGTDARPEVSTDTKSLFADVTKVKMVPDAVPQIAPTPVGGRRMNRQPALEIVQ